MTDYALDIGGANLKAAHSAGGSWSLGFNLWQRPQCLADHLRELVAVAPGFDRVLLTMTAELCDCFQTKREGVHHVLDAVANVVGDRPLLVWTVERRFVGVAAAREKPLSCAAANWIALASWVARLWADRTSVLIDTGSTTTDVVLLENGEPRTTGLTDTQRLATGELVYIGATRTPLCALGPRVAYDGASVPIMAEHFATSSDVHLLTGDLPAEPDCTDTADGRPKTPAAAAARIARMIGADSESLTAPHARCLARSFSAVMTRQVAKAIRLVVGDCRPQRIVTSGSGDFLAAAAAAVAMPRVTQVRLADKIGAAASRAACAAALLQLCEP